MQFILFGVFPVASSQLSLTTIHQIKLIVYHVLEKKKACIKLDIMERRG